MGNELLENEASWTSYLGTIFNVASDAASGSIDSRYHSTLVAIVFSAAAMEGYLNELLERLDRLARSSNQQVPERIRNIVAVAAELESRHVSFHLKLQVLCSLLSDRTLDKGTSLYQDVDLLVRLRNALMHYRSESIRHGAQETGSNERHIITKRLVARGLVPREKADGFWMFGWMAVAGSEVVAQWAHTTARSFVIFLETLLPRGWEKASPMYRPGPGEEVRMPDPRGHES
jgi:hypothetical protein